MEAYESYKVANAAYRRRQTRRQDHIVLRSARRPASEQEGYYLAYVRHLHFGGPFAPAANKPGQSDHELGFAIDVNLTVDGEAFKAELRAAGWVDNKPTEPWHFDAAHVPAWNGAQNFQKGLLPLSNKSAEAVYGFLTAEQEVTRLKEDFNRRSGELQPERERLARLREELARRNERLKETNQYLSSEKESIRRLREENVALRQRIDTMVYDRCPEGARYEDCTHEDRKSAWRAERAALEDRWRTQSDQAVARQQGWEMDYQEYVAAQNGYVQDDAKLREDELKLRRNMASLRELQTQHAEATGRRSRLERERKALLAEIQSKIETFRSGVHV